MPYCLKIAKNPKFSKKKSENLNNDLQDYNPLAIIKVWKIMKN
jgi:hypothetical protein